MLLRILSGIWENAPVWVWPLLLVLLVIGFNAARTRNVSVFAVYGLVLLGVMSVNSVGSLADADLAWSVFGPLYLVGYLLGFRFQTARVRGFEGLRVTLAGEWMTMSVVMTIFWMNFAGGVAQVVAPQFYVSSAYVVLCAGVIGLASGTFLGRAMSVFVARRVHLSALAK